MRAGVMCCPQRKTEDGFEMHWQARTPHWPNTEAATIAALTPPDCAQTNFLSHFLLANLLQPALQVGSTPQLHSRVVSVASTGHRWQTVLLDDYNLEKKVCTAVCGRPRRQAVCQMAVNFSAGQQASAVYVREQLVL